MNKGFYITYGINSLDINIEGVVKDLEKILEIKLNKEDSYEDEEYIIDSINTDKINYFSIIRSEADYQLTDGKMEYFKYLISCNFISGETESNKIEEKVDSLRKKLNNFEYLIELNYEIDEWD